MENFKSAYAQSQSNSIHKQQILPAKPQSQEFGKHENSQFPGQQYYYIPEQSFVQEGTKEDTTNESENR